jgi:hypothetical protein
MTLDELLDGIDQLTDETRDNGLSEIAAERLRAVRDFCKQAIATPGNGDFFIGKESCAESVLDVLDGTY